jgi:peptidoglycan/xylan/chitin deacetylase (PgdA/CDA1 family)
MAPIRQLDFNSAGGRGDAHPLKLYFLYHALSETPSNYAYTLSADQFQDHISLFAGIRAAGDPSLLPEVTFDDGHRSNIEMALPILQAHNLSAHFFVTVGWTGKKIGYMGWTDLKILRDCGQQIGAHGWSHSFLTECNHRELRQELFASRLQLEDKLGVEIRTMACPGGRYDHRVIAACKEAGYQRVYTSVPELENRPPAFLVGRVNAHSMMTAQHVHELMLPGSKALRRLKRDYLAKAIAKKLLSDRIYDRLWWKLTHSPGKVNTEFDADEDSARHQ